MKITLLFPLIAAGLMAQIATPPQNPQAPPMAGRPEVSHPQPGTTLAPPSPDKEVAKINGKPLTVAEAEKILGDLPVKFQVMVTRDPEHLLQNLLVFRELARQAEEQGLDKENPYRQELVYSRFMTLAQAEVERSRNAARVSSEDEQKYYEEKKEGMFRVVKAKAIFVGFAPAPPASGAPAPAVNGTTRTEAEAKTKIDDLRKQALAGADFGKLAKENSDDKISSAKDGDYGDIIRTSPYPEPIKKAIFGLKPGEVSEPIRQPTGFYLIKAADSSYQPMDTVRQQIHDALVGQEFQKHMDALQSQFTVTIEDKTYFSTRPAR